MTRWYVRPLVHSGIPTALFMTRYLDNRSSPATVRAANPCCMMATSCSSPLTCASTAPDTQEWKQCHDPVLSHVHVLFATRIKTNLLLWFQQPHQRPMQGFNMAPSWQLLHVSGTAWHTVHCIAVRILKGQAPEH